MYISILIVLLFSYANAQITVSDSQNTFTLMFYNLENFFDTIDDPKVSDNQFLPFADKKWDSQKYLTKLDHISSVISSVNTEELPEIVGVCEVENLPVLEDLVQSEKLKGADYSIIHYDSPDMRGIDVALLYRPDEFKCLKKRSIPVNFDFDKRSRVRDILYVKGVVSEKDTIHIFINHWKSRAGGSEQTEPKRIYSAILLRAIVDSVFTTDHEARIIIMGDFNDEPADESLLKVLNASDKRDGTNYTDLYNMMFDKKAKEGLGTYFYNGEWNMLDNIIVSQALLNDKEAFHTGYEDAGIFSPDWIMYHNKKNGQVSPSHTYVGNYYAGGYSDHLPVYITLRKE